MNVKNRFSFEIIVFAIFFKYESIFLCVYMAGRRFIRLIREFAGPTFLTE